MAKKRSIPDDSILEFLTKSDSEDEDFDADSEEDVSDCEEESAESTHLQNISTSSSNDTSNEVEELATKRRKTTSKGIDWFSGDFTPKIHNFDSSSSGCKAALSASSPIRSFFEVFFSTDLVTLISEETNRFFEYTMEISSEVTVSRIKTWRYTTPEEIYSFLAITLLMPRVKKLSLHEYWTKDILMKTPIFGDLMTRDRYLSILRMLHFSDNRESNQGDRLFKIRPVVDHLRAAFKNNLVPFKNLCIDESLMLFKGRLFFKQFIPSKRSRFGIKTFVICDCETGFILDFVVYTGAKSDIVEQHADLGKSGDIVSTLMHTYLDKGHTLYVDNWYSSPALFCWLHDRATNACGTVRRSRRDMPRMEEKLKKGELRFRSSEKLLALKWCDKREVWMLSTCHSAGVIETTKKDRQTGVVTKKPECIVDYNRFMGAVDKADMMLSSIESVRKSLKWYKKFFFPLG
ncbi:piggyBac transposable element-derived protein 4-like [Ischnura elegans]|uniref:piggyBac transposable element-derived protein 4-like n=1 Tax=Ischnura elegans TaxID=197161 RepID=UPI001ED87A23|nr:piggyBac transposable element-derived protein 4-like [Ischnura elegans]